MSRNPRRAYEEHGNEITSMTLATMRANGVCSIVTYCEAIGCGHAATINAHSLPDDLQVLL